MASSGAALWSVCLFLATATSQIFNTTVFGDYNITYSVTDNYSTQPTAFNLTATTPSYTTTDPVQPQPAEPLPVSGSLLTAITEVDRLCPCDAVRGVCDINCCCDTECSVEVSLFTGCSVSSVSGYKLFCSHDVASYRLGSAAGGPAELRSSIQKETNDNIFCIQSHSRTDEFSHPSPTLPTDNSFDSLFKQFPSFNSGQVSTAEPQASSGYQYGDVIMTAGESGQKGLFWLPAAGPTGDCVDNNPAAFLKDQSSQCRRRVVLYQDCSSLPALKMDTYTNNHLFAGKNTGAAVQASELKLDLPRKCLYTNPRELDHIPRTFPHPEVVPVKVASVILQSVNKTQTELNISQGENLRPTLLNPDLCANVVLKVVYAMTYNTAGEIVSVTVSLVLGFVQGATVPLKQEFQIRFVQSSSEEGAVPYSGNPGYTVGLPLVSGTRTAEGILRSIDPSDTLSLLHNAEDQDCLRGPHQRSPVLFGVDFVSGCTLRLEDTANCLLASRMLLDVLRGPSYPLYVASFGNSLLNSPLDWVQIQNIFSFEAAQACSIPLSLHLEIEWTKYGSLVNPQTQIVSVREAIQTNTTSLDLLSGGNSFLSVRSSVAFKSVSTAASPGYRTRPTINTKLPFDFFFPFV